VPHEGIREVTVAEHIDPKYAQTLKEVMANGVEVMAARVLFSVDQEQEGMQVTGELLPVLL